MDEGGARRALCVALFDITVCLLFLPAFDSFLPDIGDGCFSFRFTTFLTPSGAAAKLLPIALGGDGLRLPIDARGEPAPPMPLY